MCGERKKESVSMNFFKMLSTLLTTFKLHPLFFLFILHHQLCEYSLENTRDLLFNRYRGRCHVVVIRPDRYIANALSEFDNFWIPGNGTMHLRQLLVNLAIEAKKSNTAIGFLFFLYRTHLRLYATALDFDLSNRLPLTILGFSKGSRVLNHLWAEWASTYCLLCNQAELDELFRPPQPPKTTAPIHVKPIYMLDWQSPRLSLYVPPYEYNCNILSSQTPLENTLSCITMPVMDLLERIDSVHWLDAHRFPTEPLVTRANARLFTRKLSPHRVPLRLFLHFTPRQIGDKTRPWIQHECETFLTQLKEEQFNVATAMYFANEPSSLINHFRILQEFQLHQDE
jgi:hypothetical protein